MAFQLQTAKRSEAKLKLAIAGPSGSGKTMSSLLLAYGLLKAEHPDWSSPQIWEKICIIDTENRSASLYSGVQMDGITIGGYQTIDFQPPFEAKSYIEAIEVAENAGMEVIIIDSLTHAWTGVGGALDKQGKIAERSGNSWTAWRTVTPEHNKLVDKMLQSNTHIIANMRAKQEYSQEIENGKKVVKAVGMGIQMRDGVEYEFTTCFMLGYDHTANATKDRTGMFDGQYFVITPDTGRKFAEWLKGDETVSQTAPKAKVIPAQQPVEKQIAEEIDEDLPFAATIPIETTATVEMVDQVIHSWIDSVPEDEREAKKKEALEKTKAICGKYNYFKVSDQETLNKLYKFFKGDV